MPWLWGHGVSFGMGCSGNFPNYLVNKKRRRLMLCASLAVVCLSIPRSVLDSRLAKARPSYPCFCGCRLMRLPAASSTLTLAFVRSFLCRSLFCSAYGVSRPYGLSVGTSYMVARSNACSARIPSPAGFFPGPCVLHKLITNF